MSHEIKKFANKVKFWEYIYSLDNKIDFRNTIKSPNFCFYYDGEKKVTNGIKTTLKELNALMGTHFDEKVSIATGNKVTLFITTESAVVKEAEKSLENVLQEDSEVLTTVEDNNKTPDWAWIKSLADTPEDKKILDDYAEKEFSIKLKRNMKISNMIKSFKKQLKS